MFTLRFASSMTAMAAACHLAARRRAAMTKRLPASCKAFAAADYSITACLLHHCGARATLRCRCCLHLCFCCMLLLRARCATHARTYAAAPRTAHHRTRLALRRHGWLWLAHSFYFKTRRRRRTSCSVYRAWHAAFLRCWLPPPSSSLLSLSLSPSPYTL